MIRIGSLTHWARDKMDAISQTTFSSAFYFEFEIRFRCNLSSGSDWQYGSIDSDNGLAPNRRQAIIWINDGLVNWRIYASLDLNELSDGPSHSQAMSYSECHTITRLHSLFHIPTCFGHGWRNGPCNSLTRLGLCNNAAPCGQPRDVEQEKHCCLPTQTSANKHNTCINSAPMSCEIYPPVIYDPYYLYCKCYLTVSVLLGQKRTQVSD